MSEEKDIYDLTPFNMDYEDEDHIDDCRDGKFYIEKAKSVASKISEILTETELEYGTNSWVCENSDILFLAIPYSAQKTLLQTIKSQLANKILINVVAPIEFKDGKFTALSVIEGSAAKKTQMLLPKTKVVSAFQTISAKHLM